jgi:hypothetical protein
MGEREPRNDRKTQLFSITPPKSFKILMSQYRFHDDKNEITSGARSTSFFALRDQLRYRAERDYFRIFFNETHDLFCSFFNSDV